MIILTTPVPVEKIRALKVGDEEGKIQKWHS
jgi:hypothetical protein